MDNNGQQWTAFRGATCISDAVFFIITIIREAAKPAWATTTLLFVDKNTIPVWSSKSDLIKGGEHFYFMFSWLLSLVFKISPPFSTVVH